MNKLTYDVAVIGGGMAGISSAIASARMGAKTLLVEKHPYCGGALTAGMVLHVAGLIDHRRICEESELSLNSSNWIVQGLASEYYKKLQDAGGAIGPHWDHELAKISLDQALLEAGVDVLYGTQFYDAHTKEEAITSVDIIFKTQKLNIKASTFVDATGDGDLGAAAGIPFVLGKNDTGIMMPATLSYMVADVDLAAESIGEMNALLVEAWKKGEIPKDMRAAILTQRYSEGKKRNELWCSVVRQWGNITDPWDYSRMERDGRRVGLEIFKYLKAHTRTFRDAYLSNICHQIWPREARHLDANYTITEADVKAQRTFDDVVARGCFYLDLHSVHPGTIGFDINWHPKEYDSYFEIPYRSLVAKGINNLLLAGRTIGADHVGHSATRVMGTGIATGQAAGTAAALCASKKSATSSQDIPLLQSTLRSQNVLI